MRPHGRARVSASRPQAFAICDRCGFLFNLVDLQQQLQYSGAGLQSENILVCRTCLDVPNPQLQARVLPPDPVPALNARPAPLPIDD